MRLGERGFSGLKVAMGTYNHCRNSSKPAAMLEKTFYDNSASAESFLNTETTMFTMVL